MELCAYLLHLKVEVKDAAYDYMNWWLSGWPGAFIAKQGYYISNPERSTAIFKFSRMGLLVSR